MVLSILRTKEIKNLSGNGCNTNSMWAHAVHNMHIERS